MPKKNWLLGFILLMGWLCPLGKLWAQNSAPSRIYSERRAGYDKTVVLTDEKVPNSVVMTYFQQGVHYTDINALVKLIPCIVLNGKTFMSSHPTGLSVNDFPGGVVAKFKINQVEVETKIMPLIVGKEPGGWDGGALFQIKTVPAQDVIIRLGGGQTMAMDHPEVRENTARPINNVVRINPNTIRFTSGAENIPVLVKSSGLIEASPAMLDSQRIQVRMPSGSGQVLIAYARQQPRLLEIGQLNFDTAYNRVRQYYHDLLESSWVKTPDENINEAFRSAIYNLEYTYIKPYGWMECLHHWYALFQQQVSAGAEWIGQSDRSKESILAQATHLMPRGNVPQFMPNGVIKRDFGGSNQYWVWQIRHYLAFTGDTPFARRIIPYLDTVIRETTHEHDPDGNLLFSWGLQIGNQEDFIGTPGDGTVPSIEMANMFRTRAELAALTGDEQGAALYERKAGEVIRQLHHELWLKDLGRFAFFNDQVGNVRLDGQYETYLYPIIWDIVDPLDQYTGLRHLLDRLTGNDGAIFCSNNFSWHSIGTWGMQSCEAQQPWAAWGFSKFGLNNLTWRPLKAMADWAMDINHRGAWPEMSTEATPGYFTPPAGLYIASTVEALFGLKMDAPGQTLDIAPSFPDSWPNATMALPEFKGDYQRKGNTLRYTVETVQSLKRDIQWKLPPAKITECLVNGQKADYSIQGGVGHMVLHIKVPSSHQTKIVITYAPISYKLRYQHAIAEGDTLQLKVQGMQITQVDDRCQVLGGWEKQDGSGSMVATVNQGLLTPYKPYGRLGQMNFSRRTFFVKGKVSNACSLWFPVDITVLPRFEATTAQAIEMTDKGCSVRLQLRNNTNKSYDGTAVVRIHGMDIPFTLALKAHAQTEMSLSLPVKIIRALSPGDNSATLYLDTAAGIPLILTARSPGTYATSDTMINLDLPVADLMPAMQWNELRVMPGFPHIFFTFSNYGWPKPMEALKDSTHLTATYIPGLTFKIPHQEFIPVSYKAGKVSYKIKLPPGTYKKIYLLVLPFVDNHDMFTQVARVTAWQDNEVVYTRTLRYPGDLDYWVPNVNPTAFATYREPRKSRFGLLPLLKPDQSDWTEGKPPGFPESKYWATCVPIVTKSALMDVIEMDLDKPMRLDQLIFESMGDFVAFGIVGAVGEIEKHPDRP